VVAGETRSAAKIHWEAQQNHRDTGGEVDMNEGLRLARHEYFAGRKCHLYRHYDKSGNLLYVGISQHSLIRLRTHRYVAQWFHEITRIEIEHFPHREGARRAEREAIINEHPRYNVAGKRSKSLRNLPIPTSLKVAKCLREFLQNTGISVGEFAKTLGVHRSAVSHWISGARKPAKNKLLKISNITGIEPEDLL
jgi:DNA-binding transcriptional regulator YiaG